MDPSPDALTEIEVTVSKLAQRLVYCRIGLELAVVLAIVELIVILAKG